MKAALLECQQACQSKQEEALEEERQKSRAAIETALQEERANTETLVAELKVCKIYTAALRDKELTQDNLRTRASSPQYGQALCRGLLYWAVPLC